VDIIAKIYSVWLVAHKLACAPSVGMAAHI